MKNMQKKGLVWFGNGYSWESCNFCNQSMFSWRDFHHEDFPLKVSLAASSSSSSSGLSNLVRFENVAPKKIPTQLRHRPSLKSAIFDELANVLRYKMKKNNSNRVFLGLIKNNFGTHEKIGVFGIGKRSKRPQMTLGTQFQYGLGGTKGEILGI